LQELHDRAAGRRGKLVSTRMRPIDPRRADFRGMQISPGPGALDLMAGCATRVFQRRVKFQVNVDNVTDEFYADKSLGYANPRTWRVSATTTF
jgi:hypothetical protein